jgi:hypothetical protein
MTHQEIQEGEMIERFVRHQLAPAERRAFQEHYFACEECFEQVQTTARFVAAVRQASRKGWLAESAGQAVAWWASLFTPALGFAVAAALLAVVFGWLMFRQPAAPRQELAHEQQSSPSPRQTSTPEQNIAQRASPTPTPERPERPKLQDQSDLLAQNRLPTVLLESARDASASSNQLTLPANATSAILRIEVEPGSRFISFQFQVFDSARRLLTTGTSGKASARGSVAIRISAGALQDGKYLVKCYGVRDGQRELIGEYDLRVRKL